MKKIALILVLVLLFGCASAEPALLRALEYSEWIDGTVLMRVEGNNGYAVADIDGNLLTEDIYNYNLYFEDGLITASLYNGDSLTSNGVLKLDGSVAVPFQYGDVEVLSNQWAIGIALAEATRDNFDYESWSDDKVYLIDHVDIYNLDSGAMLTLPRTNYEDAAAYGSTINIKDRSTGKVTAYDASFNALGEIDSVYSEDFAKDYLNSFYSDGLYGLKNGDDIVLEPAYDYIYDFDGEYTEYEMDGMYGIIDRQGNIVIPAEYDGFETSYYISSDAGDNYGIYAGGYFCFVKDGKMGFMTSAGVTCEAKYSESIMENNGASATFTDMEGNLNIMAGDGVITPIAGYDDVSCAYYSNGFYYIIRDEDYNEGLIDWHGNVIFPCEYSDVSLSGDGRYALVEVEYGEYELYLLDAGAAAAVEVAAEAPVEVAAEAPAPAEEGASLGNLLSKLQQSAKGTAVEAPVVEAPAEEDPVEEAPAEETEAPAENEFADLAKEVLESAKIVTLANAESAITLLDSAMTMLGDHPAVGILQGAKALLAADAQANSAAIITLIDNAIAML